MIDIIEKPEYNNRTREYAYLDGTVITEAKCMRDLIERENKIKEQRLKRVAEERLQFIQSMAVMEEMLNGAAPSMMQSRLKARNLI